MAPARPDGRCGGHAAGAGRAGRGGGSGPTSRTDEAPGDRHRRLLLPPGIAACLFDLDGVLTSTARVHAAAWKETFDAFLAGCTDPGADTRPFDADADYRRYVDGRLREDGVRTFLASRHITLPEGTGTGPPEATVRGLAAAKNALVLERLATDGVETFAGSVRFLDAVRASGLRTAVVSASANTAAVLDAAGLRGRFDAVVDGLVARREHLAGKPSPDTYLAAARRLGIAPGAAAVFEDAEAGVAAGRAGGFGLVVGVDRRHHPEVLRARGADVVVADLAELLQAA